jgi:hypothetical protein
VTTTSPYKTIAVTTAPPYRTIFQIVPPRGAVSLLAAPPFLAPIPYGQPGRAQSP